MILSLVLFAQIALRTYYPVPISELGRNRHTHVRVQGIVTLVKHEKDGDLHIRLSDGKGSTVVCECIPALPCAEPIRGEVIEVWGISRQDRQHGGWEEVHPVEKWAESQKGDTGE